MYHTIVVEHKYPVETINTLHLSYIFIELQQLNKNPFSHHREVTEIRTIGVWVFSIMASQSLRVILTVFATQTLSAAAFTALSSTIHSHVTTSQATPSVLLATPHGVNSNTCAITSSRRSFLDALITTSTMANILGSPLESLAEEEKVSSAKLRPLSDCIYNILRVREATEQETRLISTGKFKDVQRANVKLAVKFMVINYRLSDSIIAASSYLSGNARMQASGAGQNAVQSLYTILEYFDSSDVENIKVRQFVWFYFALLHLILNDSVKVWTVINEFIPGEYILNDE